MNVENQLIALSFTLLPFMVVGLIKGIVYIQNKGGHVEDYIVVPKTSSPEARRAYLQLLTLCSDINVKPEAIQKAIERVEHDAQVYFKSPMLNKSKGCQDMGKEMEAVARYYRWYYGNISHIRTSTIKQGV